MNLQALEVSKDNLKKIVENREYNQSIIDYYHRFSKANSIAFSKDLLEKKAEKIDYCNKYWQLDKYDKQKIKDFKKTNLCHDKFCANCKKVKQAARMSKYIPELEKYKSNLYHLVLTVPNCEGTELNYTYKKMAKSFKTLIRYFTGNLKIKNINFDRLGYAGAIRSLEVTFKENSYHPHFHVALVLENDLFKKSDMQLINKYSYNYRNGVPELKRMFHPDEILIQKIWYLLMNDIRVNEKSIRALNDGYSCLINKFKEDDYAELFKYVTKSSDESGNILSYENFVSLYHGLYRVKQIQGYGCLYNIDDDIDMEAMELQYEDFILSLKEKESPSVCYQQPKDLINDTDYTLISRKSFFKYLKTIL